MKKITRYLLFVSGFVFLTFALSAQDFITKWTFPTAATRIPFKMLTNGAVNYTWTSTSNPTGGNGSLNQPSLNWISIPITITAGDVVTLSLSPTNLKHIDFSLGVVDENVNLTDVSQWGAVAWSSAAFMFSNCTNLVTFSATDSPNFSGVTDMSYMFSGAKKFNHNISSWNVGNITYMNSMFSGAKDFNQNIGGWNTGNVTDMGSMFYFALSFNQNIGGWNVSNVESMRSMFRGTRDFNQDIGGWNTSKVKDMNSMFASTTSFNQDIGDWNTSNITNMGAMFKSASAFNQNIGRWNTSSVEDMSGMFRGTRDFNQYIGNWNTENVYYMDDMFSESEAFDQDIGNWKLDKVANMSYMFYGAKAFNQNIGGWNTSSVGNMNYMFGLNTIFNQPIGNWNTGNVYNMDYMFYEATAFNQDIGGWNTSNVYSMNGMFEGAAVFNQNISGWDTKNVEEMDYMFLKAPAFNQNLGKWPLNSLTRADNMFGESGMSCQNYSLTLKGWSENGNTNSDVSFDEQTNMKYANAAVAFRDNLINNKGWWISDDALVSPSDPCYSMALPIQFGSIDAYIKNGQLFVNWTTLTESNNDFFIIEASTDGKTFTTISDKIFTKTVKGISNTEQHYDFTSSASLLKGISALFIVLSIGFRKRNRIMAAGCIIIALSLFSMGCQKNENSVANRDAQQIYIRIVQVDKDGGKTYSKVVVANKQ